MLKKIFTISLVLLLALFVAASPTMASNGKNSHQEKINKSNSVYDLNVSDDNAHPSGKNRSVEHGHSNTQGKSKSDPDNNGKGPDRFNTGLDKPGKGGGVAKYDQDGNNGCGNDDDFEDDNEGWCGQKPKQGKVEEPGCSEKPKVPTIAVGSPEPTPTVLTVSRLPETASGESANYAWVLVATTLVLAGSGVHLAVKKYEEIF